MALRELHWLPIKQPINFKIAFTVFKCLHDQAPSNLKDLISVKIPGRLLISSLRDVVGLNVPVYSRSFAVSGPILFGIACHPKLRNYTVLITLNQN